MSLLLDVLVLGFIFLLRSKTYVCCVVTSAPQNTYSKTCLRKICESSGVGEEAVGIPQTAVGSRKFDPQKLKVRG